MASEVERKRKKVERAEYDEKSMKMCIENIQSGKQTKYRACKTFGIPESTIRYRMGGKWSKKTRKGPNTVMEKEEEAKVVKWLKEMQKKGFPVTTRMLTAKVKQYFDHTQKPNPFRDNRPGRKWVKGFQDRHKHEISLRTPEAVTAASAKVSEADIRGWFANVSSYLEERSLKEILDDPTRVYNGDETAFFLNPKTRAVLAERGSRNVYEVEHTNSKTNITVMFTFGADGSIVPPDVILPMKRLRTELLRTFPADWGVGKSDRGWMDTENFELHIRRVFHPFLVKKGVTFPVIYFVDGHSSHMAADVADTCLELGIILIALYPNTTRITQPADVAIFKPLKNAWKTAVSNWRDANNGESLTIDHFSMVLQDAMKQGIMKNSIVNGFRTCGLQPFNANSIDYSKCIANCDITPDSNLQDDRLSTNSITANYTAHTLDMVESVVIPSEDVKLALECIGREKLMRITSGEELNSDERVIKDLYGLFIEPFLSPIPSNNIDETVSSNHCKTPELSSVQDESQQFQHDFPDELPQHSQQSYYQDGFEYQRSASYSELWNLALVPCNEPSVDSNNNLSHASKEIVTIEEQQPGTSRQMDSATDNAGLSRVSEDLESSVPRSDEMTLRDITNQQHTGTKRKMSLTGFLTCPETPKRSRCHRNYQRKIYPVLTAGERLEEIRQIEENKIKNAERKKENAERRVEKKLESQKLKLERAQKRAEKRNEAVQIKETMRQRKREQAVLRKKERENLRKTGKKQEGDIRGTKKDWMKNFNLFSV